MPPTVPDTGLGTSRTDPGLSPAAEPLRAHTDGGRAAVCVVVGSRKGCGTGSTMEAGGALRAGLWMKLRPPEAEGREGPWGGGARRWGEARRQGALVTEPQGRPSWPLGVGQAASGATGGSE